MVELFGLFGPGCCHTRNFNVEWFVLEKSIGGRFIRSMRVFNNFILEINLRDPNLFNAEFTWSNMRERANAVCRRLDRFLFINEWEA